MADRLSNIFEFIRINLLVVLQIHFTFEVKASTGAAVDNQILPSTIQWGMAKIKKMFRFRQSCCPNVRNIRNLMKGWLFNQQQQSSWFGFQFGVFVLSLYPPKFYRPFCAHSTFSVRSQKCNLLRLQLTVSPTTKLRMLSTKRWSF